MVHVSMEAVMRTTGIFMIIAPNYAEGSGDSFYSCTEECHPRVLLFNLKGIKNVR